MKKKQIGLLLAAGVLLAALSGCYTSVTTYSYPPTYHQPYYGGYYYYKPHYSHRGHRRGYHYRGYQRRHY